ncbi:MAG: HEAT repeat domain-containing protein [Acidobacteriota bacterium]|nr:HEAT repeat domain-containing protein [Acidobacteriota bacterium]
MSRKVFLAVSLIALMAALAATFAQDKPKRTYTKNDFINISKEGDGGNLNDRIERAFKQFKSSKQPGQGDSVWLAYHFPAREGSYIGPFGGTVYYDDGIKLEHKDDPASAAIFLLTDATGSSMKVTRVKTLSLKEDFVFEDRQVYWLGNADPGQSLTYLTGLMRGDKENKDLVRGALRAISSHDSPRVVSLLKEFAVQESNVELQRSAVSNLARVRTTESTDALISLYDEAKDDAVKDEIIAGLARAKERKAADKLLAIAKNDVNPKMRQRAIRRISTATASGIWIN